MEVRNHRGTVEVRLNERGEPMIVGYGVVFNRDSSDMGFIEQVDPEAATKTLAEADIRALGNHDVNWLLGRTKPGTLRLRADQTGVFYEIDVNEADPDGVRALEKVRRGDWDGSSFSFEAVRDQWDWQSEPPRRRLLEFKMIDIGPVTFNAYPDATAAARSALEPIAKRTGKNVDELVTAMRSGEIRSLLATKVVEEIAEEARAGKTLSAKSLASVQAAHESVVAAMSSLRDLLDQALEEEPGDAEDGNEDNSIEAAKEMDSLRSAILLSMDSLFVKPAETATETPVAGFDAEARLRVRERELALLQNAA